jgi:hypothetical protein
MKYKEVLSHLTGFSVPIFGVSWNPPKPEVKTARKVLAFLEDRRVLYNPYYLEVEDQCFSSVIEIRKFLTDIIGELGEDSKLGGHLRGIRAACRAFLNESSPGSRRIHRFHEHSPFDSSFFTALGELRSSIGMHIAAIAVMHGLDIKGELESILPAKTIEEDKG